MRPVADTHAHKSNSLDRLVPRIGYRRILFCLLVLLHLMYFCALYLFQDVGDLTTSHPCGFSKLYDHLRVQSSTGPRTLVHLDKRTYHSIDGFALAKGEYLGPGRRRIGSWTFAPLRLRPLRDFYRVHSERLRNPLYVLGSRATRVSPVHDARNSRWMDVDRQRQLAQRRVAVRTSESSIEQR